MSRRRLARLNIPIILRLSERAVAKIVLSGRAAAGKRRTRMRACVFVFFFPFSLPIIILSSRWIDGKFLSLSSIAIRPRWFLSLSLYQAGSLERMSGTRSSHVPGSLFPPFTTREYKIVDIMKKKEKKEKLPLISFQTFVCACCGMDSIKPFSLLLLLLVLFFSSSGVLLLRDG